MVVSAEYVINFQPFTGVTSLYVWKILDLEVKPLTNQ